MKYYFTYYCYWDSEKLQIIRNDTPVKLPSDHKKLLTTLLKNNGHFVSHEALYFAMTGCPPDSNDGKNDWKELLSNRFTRKRESEKGLLERVPEIKPFFDKSKRQSGGGYKISVPEENIVDPSTNNVTIWDEYRDIWHSKKYWVSQQLKARIIEKDLLTKKVKLYLQGEQCSWPLVFASSQYAPVKRDIVEELLDEIDNKTGAIVLTAAGGEGKTTVLMQLCVELYNAGKNVLYHTNTDSCKYDIPDNIVNDIFLVDNPVNTTAFKSFLTRATKEGLTVVIAARSNEWATLKETLFADTKRSVKEIELPKISVSESKAFAQYLKAHVHWIKRSTVELEKLFFKDSYGFLYASMLMAIYNADSLEKIAEEIVDRISKFENGQITLKILAAIVFAEQAGTAIGTRIYRVLCKTFSVDDKDVKYYLRKEVVLNGKVYQTRHESISQLFYKYLFREGDWWSYLNEEEREDIVIAVLDAYLDEVEKSTEDYRPTNPRAIEASSLLVQTFKVVDYEETQDFIIQRLLESCQQHGHTIIDRFYHHLDNVIVKCNLATKCYERKLPLWEVYRHWLRYLSSEDVPFNTVENYIETLCLDMDAPVGIWNLWIDLLEKNIQDNSVSINKAREVYKRGFNVLSDNAHWWIACASFEEHFGNLGDVGVEYSARWLLREGCIHVQDNPHLWMKWAEIETRVGNIGDYGTPNSVAWIFKEACINQGIVSDSAIWLKWADFSIHYNANMGINNLDVWTPSKILQCACIEHNAPDSQAWIKWARIEEDRGNIGSYQIPYSAAWIFKEVCMREFNNSDQAWEEWAYFVERNIDKSSLLIDFPLDAILKPECLSGTINVSPWLAWSIIEETRGNIGDYTTEYSAAWLYQESCVNHNPTQNANCLIKWTRFANKYPMPNEHGEIINAEYVLEYAQRTCPAFSNELWEDLANLKKEMGYLY